MPRRRPHRGPGRPVELRERRAIMVYVTRRERAAIRERAARDGVSMSGWVRFAVLTVLGLPPRPPRPTPYEIATQVQAALAALKERKGTTP
jgi:hypothetical protein